MVCAAHKAARPSPYLAGDTLRQRQSAGSCCPLHQRRQRRARVVVTFGVDDGPQGFGEAAVNPSGKRLADDLGSEPPGGHSHASRFVSEDIEHGIGQGDRKAASEHGPSVTWANAACARSRPALAYGFYFAPLVATGAPVY